jgi:NAD(P)-dependent dehydrogenase (short-subunit alcohol dehydrogenase family)
MEAHMYDVPDLHGRLAVVTGGNSGTGKEAVKRLAAAGASVVMAVRTPAKGDAARAEILAAVPAADIAVDQLDLADLGSVHAFVDRLAGRTQTLDLLLNNAGVMAVPTRMVTVDGFELQFATNYLGPFALTNRLLPLLLATPNARVTTMSSGLANRGRISFDDLQLTGTYTANRAYAQSKLADLMLARHLAAISTRHGWSLMSNAAHPGFTITNLQTAGPNLGRATPRRSFFEFGARVLPHQQPEQGAEPMLFAATSAAATNGGYYGPTGRFGLVGPSGPAKLNKRTGDDAVAERLWAVAADLTGVDVPVDSL